MAAETFQTWQVSEPCIGLRCELGEGPYYEKSTNSLRFVDLKKNQFHTLSLDGVPGELKTGEVKTVDLDVPVSVTADIEGIDPRDKILLGLKYGVAVLDRKTGKYEYIAKYADEDNIRLRSNDGAVDPHGRFWVGTMTDFGYDLEPEGMRGLVRTSAGKKTTEVVRRDVPIPNSVGWSPDLKTMYFVDTMADLIYAWDYSAADGSLSNERVFFDHRSPGDRGDDDVVDKPIGGPDGFKIDVQGNMWLAVFGGACVLKISPQGKLVGKIKLPTLNVTCPEFVGTELFITTASDDEAAGGPQSKEFGGGLFRVDVGVAGVKPFEFKPSV